MLNRLKYDVYMKWIKNQTPKNKESFRKSHQICIS